MVCVDGGQPNTSSGMTLTELADFMKSLGCESALNLDGGGSTTMVIRNRAVNRPSDGQERNISSALMVRKKD
jgi:exopolysaccharide biosynthesis protein